VEENISNLKISVWFILYIININYAKNN
jgi:hypothetical protein